MKARKVAYINGHRISLYGWLWWKEVYLDKKLFDGTFREAVVKCSEEDGEDKFSSVAPVREEG